MCGSQESKSFDVYVHVDAVYVKYGFFVSVPNAFTPVCMSFSFPFVLPSAETEHISFALPCSDSTK